MVNKTIFDSMQELQDEVNGILSEVRDLRRQMYKDGWVKFERPTVEQLLKEGHQWESWYAWHPVKDVHGVWHWGKEIYRILGNTYMDHDNWRWYYYGTAFDILK